MSRPEPGRSRAPAYPIMRHALRLPRAAVPALLAATLALAGCADDPVRPDPGGPAIRGVVQVTFTGLGGPAPSVQTRIVEAGGSGESRVLLVPSNTDGFGGGGGIQLVPSFTGDFTDGERGAGGQRYAYATFVVRNAAADGTPYDTPRRNLTFLAVARTDGIDSTAVVSMKRFGGADARRAIARQIRPTGAAARNANGEIHANGVDVLQAFSEADVAGISLPPGIISALPYGFMARTTSGGREIPVGGEGVLTLAFRIPLQATAAADPYEITFSFLVMEDSETRITQSLQEQDPLAQQDFAIRVRALDAELATLLPGSGYFDVARPTRTLCSVRTAGTAASPTAYMFSPVPAVSSLSPNPYGPWGGVVPLDGVISATFAGPVGKPDDRNFTVNGSLGGRRFLGAQYAGGGNTTGAATPAGNYFPGEELEVTLTTALACNGLVARLRAASGAASGNFAGSALASSGGPTDVAVGDLNGDRVLDIVEARFNVDSIAVRLGNAGGTFRAPVRYRVQDGPRALALADFNGDGRLDVVVTHLNTPAASLMLGDGTGAFVIAPTENTAAQSQALAVGDVNADGRLDFVTGSQANGTVKVVLNRGGSFEGATYSIPSVSDLVLYDVTGDGRLDIVATQFLSSQLTVLPRLPNGGFGPPISTTTGSQPISLALGDVTGDGIADALVGSATDAQVVLMAGAGNGSFGPQQGLIGASYPVAVVLADADGNGKLDVVVVDRDQHVARVVLNHGGSFSALPPVALGSSPRAVVLADLNGNGRLDLLSANAGSNNLSVLFDAP
jgi:hypothetical protein